MGGVNAYEGSQRLIEKRLIFQNPPQIAESKNEGKNYWNALVTRYPAPFETFALLLRPQALPESKVKSGAAMPDFRKGVMKAF